MTTTKFDICTMAAHELGADEVQSFDDGTRESEVFSSLYENIYDDLLTTLRPAFATKTEELSRVSGDPADPSWDYHYQRPSDLLVVKRVMDESGTDVAFEVEGDRFLTNSSRSLAKFVYRIDESLLPPWFVRALYLKLAYAAAEPLVGMGSVKERIGADLEVALARANISLVGDEPPRSTVVASRLAAFRVVSRD